MSEEPELKPGSLAQKLSRLTPDTSGLDRDELLVRLGRASATPRRFWPVLAGGLALSQAVTLFLLLSRTPEAAIPPGPAAPPPAPAVPASDSGPDASPPAPELWSYRKALRTGNLDDLPADKADGDVSKSDEVMTVLSLRSFLARE